MLNIVSQSKWVKQQPGVADLPVNTQKQMYDEYVASQHISQQTELTTTDLVTQRYREFLKSVLISITDEDVEIRRFLRNIDINNKEDVSLIIPFYVERLKQIGSYFVNKRREVFTVTDTVGYNGSAEGIKREMKRFLLTLLSDLSFKTKYKSADIPNVDVLTENAVIEIEELYEEVESDDSKIKQQIEAILFLDPDFKRNIVSLFKTLFLFTSLLSSNLFNQI